MVSDPVPAADERRHRAGPESWWGETWGFEFAAPDASLGGFVQITVYPRRNIAWFWAAIVGEGRRYVLCRDHEVTPPANPGVLEVRSVALWSHAICETPLEHWTVAMEAFAVALDDPFDAWAGERGHRVGLAFDLEWESVATSAVRTRAVEGMKRYDVPCTVNGTLQIDDESLTVEHVGWRHHAWGVLDWSPAMLSGIRANGMGARPRSEWSDGNTSATTGANASEGDWTIGPPATRRSTVADAPLLVDRPGGSPARLLRSLERVVCDEAPAPGWTEHEFSDRPPDTPRRTA